MEIYEKLSAAVESATQIKSELTSLHGIGEPVPVSVFGWKNNQIVGRGFLEVLGQEKKDKLAAAGLMVSQMRFTDQIEEATIIMDGFVRLGPGQADDEDDREHQMERTFAWGEGVSEALLIFHYAAGSDQADLVAIPYETGSRSLEVVGGEWRTTRDWDAAPESEDYLLSETGMRRYIKFSPHTHEQIPATGPLGRIVTAFLNSDGEDHDLEAFNISLEVL